ncbi:helix-turn-helix transcriptional regulator [Arthrobacter citreus]|nr:helix-turn-helix transcriptional regulator [Arthrobacter citreus]
MFVSRLRMILDEKGIKYSHIAKKAGISKTAMNDLVKEENPSLPSYKSAYYIAKELNVKMEDIWYFEE